MNLQGIVVKSISSFYTVDTPVGRYVCKARGIFKKDKTLLLVGDKVEIRVTDEEEKEGIIEELFPRTNLLVRPPIANVTKALLFFSIKDPEPNRSLIDRFIVLASEQNLEVSLCFSKTDLDEDGRLDALAQIYKGLGYPFFDISTYEGRNIQELKNDLKGHITVIAGPSGAGKSSFINTLNEDFEIKTGKVSEKIGRGRHTTRHTELLKIDEDSWIADTPGFSSLSLEHIPSKELKEYFVEFHDYDIDCKFGYDCIHDKEPDCRVREALEQGRIGAERYESYKQLLKEIQEQEKRR